LIKIVVSSTEIPEYGYFFTRFVNQGELIVYSMKEIVQDIINSLEEFADPDRIEFAKRSYPTGMKVIGVTVPRLKQVLKEVKAGTRGMDPGDKLQIAGELVDTGIFECRQLAYEWIGNDRKILGELDEAEVDRLGQNLDNWVSVDYYAALIVGYAWRTGRITTDKVKAYLRSEDVWIRRIAVVATVALNQKARGGTGDPIRTLEICEGVVDDHADMINKALSWALRELAKVDREPVVSFLDRNRDRIHKRVLREVGNKLETGKKN
jgi:3-methyladenine DNA glycosylase AlkD